MNPSTYTTPYDRSHERFPAKLVVTTGATTGCSSCYPCGTLPTAGTTTTYRIPSFGVTGFNIAVTYPST